MATTFMAMVARVMWMPVATTTTVRAAVLGLRHNSGLGENVVVCLANFVSPSPDLVNFDQEGDDYIFGVDDVDEDELVGGRSGPLPQCTFVKSLAGSFIRSFKEEQDEYTGPVIRGRRETSRLLFPSTVSQSMKTREITATAVCTTGATRTS